MMLKIPAWSQLQLAQAAAEPGPSARLSSASILAQLWLEPAKSWSHGNTTIQINTSSCNPSNFITPTLQNCISLHLLPSTPYLRMSTCSTINLQQMTSSHLFNQMANSYIHLIHWPLHLYSGPYIAWQDTLLGPHHMAFITTPLFCLHLRDTFHKSTWTIFVCNTQMSSPSKRITPSIYSMDIPRRTLLLGTATSKQWDNLLFNGFRWRSDTHFSWGLEQDGIVKCGMAPILNIWSAISSLAVPWEVADGSFSDSASEGSDDGLDTWEDEVFLMGNPGDE